jgi:cytochrome b pre-mRNA-processing protein 3
MGIGQWFRRGKRARWAVDKLHQSIVNQALRPEFYGAGCAKDTFSGRFELTSLHAALVFRRLRATGSSGKALAQECFDALFEGFDEALRDIGTGDLSVGKKIRKMGEAFYGRARAYDLSLAPDAAQEALSSALFRNLGLSDEAVARFERYVRSADEALQRQSDEALLAGEVSWPKPPAG